MRAGWAAAFVPERPQRPCPCARTALLLLAVGNMGRGSAKGAPWAAGYWQAPAAGKGAYGGGGAAAAAAGGCWGAGGKDWYGTKGAGKEWGGPPGQEAAAGVDAVDGGEAGAARPRQGFFTKQALRAYADHSGSCLFSKGSDEDFLSKAG